MFLRRPFGDHDSETAWASVLTSPQPTERLGASAEAAQEPDEAGRVGLLHAQPLPGFIGPVPVPPRDRVDMDDMDSRAEDHVGDEIRYRLPTREWAAGWNALRRSELLTTETELSAMAAAAHIGSSLAPRIG